jgi:hypothetical protein
MKLKILIAGDSFAADFTIKYPGSGWPNVLASEFNVTNLAQAGCGEYKILLQLKSQNLHEYDVVIVSHTSPYRLHTLFHPIHHQDLLHHNSDFLYADVVAHNIDSIREYFEKYFDLDHAQFVHNLICKEIAELVRPIPHIHMIHMDCSYKFDNLLNCEPLYQKHPGFQNHYNELGNLLVSDAVKKRLAKI